MQGVFGHVLLGQCMDLNKFGRHTSHSKAAPRTRMVRRDRVGQLAYITLVANGAIVFGGCGHSNC